MKLTNKKMSNKKKALLAVAAAVVLAGGYFAYAYATHTFPFKNDTNVTKESDKDHKENDVNYNKPTSDQASAGDKAKQDFVNDHYTDDNSSTGNTGGAAGDKTAVSATFSSFNQNGGVMQIRTTIGEISSTGKCTLTLSRSGYGDVVQEAATQSLGSYSVCKGFDVPVSSLAPGTWNAKLAYASDTGSATITKSFEVK